MKGLETFYEGDLERVGYVTRDAEIVELRNIATKPEIAFRLSGADTARLLAPDVAATWHTHPGTSSNLTMEDHPVFLKWPQLRHYIVGNDGVACYAVDDGVLVRVEP